MREMALKLGITGAASSLVVLHVVRPAISIDGITLGLVALAILPWLSTLFESVELPGGLKVRYRDVERASQALKRSESGVPSKPAVFLVDTDDPNLAVVALRIEVEKRIRALATKHGIQGRTLSELLLSLRNAGAIDARINEALLEFVKAGNRAAHGARVEREVADWAQKEGPFILGYLDQMIGPP